MSLFRILLIESISFDVQYLDDGKSESGVPAAELRLLSGTSELPQSFAMTNSGQQLAPKKPRAVVHGKSVEEEESSVFVVEGQQEKVAMGGGVRGVRFLRNSTRA